MWVFVYKFEESSADVKKKSKSQNKKGALTQKKKSNLRVINNISCRLKPNSWDTQLSKMSGYVSFSVQETYIIYGVIWVTNIYDLDILLLPYS